MKKLIVSILLLLPLGLVAQELKIAVVNTNTIMATLPDVAEAHQLLQSMAAQYDADLKMMQEDYERKVSEFTAQGDTLNENIRVRRIQEIQGIQERIENAYPAAQEDMNRKQEELFTPIRAKVQKAIAEVGSEIGYTYIFEPQYLLYIGDAAIDITDKVKAKLGLE